jgi:cytochrome P450
VVQEAMRLYPPAYVFGREAICDTAVAGYRVPKGTSVLICQWLMHRDSRYFPDPAEFRPERWTEEFQRELPTYAYLPFGGGPRICIGKEFAMAEAGSILSMLAARFDLSLISDPQPWPTVTLRPSGPVTTRVKSVCSNT